MSFYDRFDLMATFQPSIERLDASPQSNILRMIWHERRTVLTRAYKYAMIAAFVLASISILTAIASKSFPNLPFWFLWIYMIFRGVTAHFVRVPRYVLLLRRFRRLSRGESVIGRIVPNAAWGFAHVITVEDKTFGGDLPLGLQAFTWFYLPIVSMVVTMLIVTYVDVVKFFLQDGPGFFGVLVIWVAIYVAIRSTFRHRLKYRCNESNWKSTLEALILKIRKRTLPHSRTTAVIRLPDQNWKQCVQLAIADSSCVVIDLTEINSNVEWEIDQALKALPPEAIVMTWAADSSNSGASSNVPPAVIRTRLFTLFGGAVLDRCRFVSYPKGKSSETVTSIAMGMAIAEAISNGEAVRSK